MGILGPAFSCSLIFLLLNMTEKENSNKQVSTVAIIPAAGSGVRMGGDQAKQFIQIDGKPLLAVTLKPFQHCQSIDGIILVVPSMDVDYCKEEIVGRFRINKVKKVVPGGKIRQESVRLGLEATGGDYGLVLIHDGVRPIIDTGLIEKLIAAARSNRAVITGLPAKETVKEVNSRKEVVRTYDRKDVWLVQTPQVFRYEDIFEAHQRAFHEGWEEATDDSLLIEKLGIPVKMIEGPDNNIKVTTPYDLELARFLLGCIGDMGR